MNRITSITGIAMVGTLALGGNVCLGGESPAFAPSTPQALPAYEVCRGTVRVSGSSRPGLPGGPLVVKVYLSEIMPRGPINDEDIRIAFEKFLNEKYGQASAAEDCKWARTLEEAQKIRDVDFRQGLEGQTFIDTGWKYTPPAKAAAPPPEHYAVCWANRNAQVKYYSAVFDGSRDDAGKWWPAFQGYLKQKYGFDGPTQCIPASGKADAEKYLRNLIEQDKKTRTMQGQPPQIVETGWRY
jgi:hypothetical protein